jgi:hypothetical protein
MNSVNVKILVLLSCWISIISSACSNPASTNDIPKQDNIILEIIDTARISGNPEHHDLLEVRLYESGRFEFDDYPGEYLPREMPNNIVRKVEKLNPEELKELVSLAEQPDFLSARFAYPAYHIIPPPLLNWDTTIRFIYVGQEKKFIILNIWDILHSDDRPLYLPQSAVKLLKRIREIKAKVGGTS